MTVSVKEHKYFKYTYIYIINRTIIINNDNKTNTLKYSKWSKFINVTSIKFRYLFTQKHAVHLLLTMIAKTTNMHNIYFLIKSTLLCNTICKGKLQYLVVLLTTLGLLSHSHIYTTICPKFVMTMSSQPLNSQGLSL